MIAVLEKEISARPVAIAQSVDNLKALHDERFKSIAIQFEERDARLASERRDAKIAIDAALQASKEAFSEQNKASALSIAKSEAAITKQMDQIGTLISATTEALNSKIDDIKSRLTLLEGTGKGGKDLLAIVFTIFGKGIAAIAAIIAFQKIT